MKTSPAKKHRECIVVTGASEFLGATIIRILERHKLNRRLIAIDRDEPIFPLSIAEYREIDLADPSAERKLLAIFKECGPNTTVVHAALPWEPVRREAYAHQLMIAGSLAIIRAAKVAKLRKLVLASTTDVYGAFANNPNYMPEESATKGGSQSFYLEGRIHVEEMFRKFEETGKNRVVTILRPCTILGPSISSFKTTFIQQPVVTTVLGFDPLIQFVHESDVLRAFLTVISKDAPGTFNIVGDGVLPLSRAIRIAKKPSVPLPEFLLSMIADVAWNFGMGFAPSRHIAFLKYPCVADGEKARQQLGFFPVYTSQEALLSFVGRE
jgi:UDP-glucose 4-epimerase